MNKGKGPFRLVLNGKASKEIEWHCKHYVGRGIMKKFGSGAEVAREIGVSPQKLADTFAEYNRRASTKSCPFGKKFFHNVPLDMNDAVFHVAQVCTVVHYTMGGLAINNESQVTSPDGIPVVGLYAAGEVAGGIHGRNRLGGNSLSTASSSVASPETPPADTSSPPPSRRFEPVSVTVRRRR